MKSVIQSICWFLSPLVLLGWIYALFQEAGQEGLSGKHRAFRDGDLRVIISLGQAVQLGFDFAFEVKIVNAHGFISWLVGFFAMTRTLS